MSFAVAFLIAVAFGAVHLLYPSADVLPVSDDSAKYHAMAQGVARLASDGSLRADLLRDQLSAAQRDSLGVDRWEFQHAPAYVVPLGLVYAVFPQDVGAGRAVSLLLYAGAAGLLVLLGRHLVGRRLRWLALGGYLFYLPLRYYGLGIATEPQAVFMVLLVAWLLVRFHRRATPSRALILGLALGLLFLSKTTFRGPAVVILLGEATWLWLRGRRRALGHGGAWSRGVLLPRLLAAAVAPLLVWTAALALMHAPFNPVVQSGEQALWLYRGNYVPDQGWQTVGLGDALTPELQAAGFSVTDENPEGLSETEHKRAMYERALRITLTRHPVGWALLVWKKFGLFWTTPPIKTYLRTFLGSWPDPWWWHRVLFPLGLLGFALTLRGRRGLWLPGVLALGVATVHALSHLVARYAIPVLPLWSLYALLGAKALVLAGRRRLPGARARWRAGPWKWALLGGLALLLGALLRNPPFAVMQGAGRILYGAGALLIALSPWAALPILNAAARRVAHAAPGGVSRAPESRFVLARQAWLWVAPLLFSAALAGQQLSEPDWDAFASRLERPGDGFLQRLAVPRRELAQRGGADSAWVEIDMQRALRGSFTLDVLVGGERVHTFHDTLEGRFEDFLFDATVHRAQARYRRVADHHAHFVERYLDPRFGRESPGFDYFRRWVRVPVPLACLRADTVEVELRLRAAAGGGGIAVLADRPAAAGAARRFVGPALSANPLEHSSYRAEFYAGDRARMDARLTRPLDLHSPWSRSLRIGAGGANTDLDPGWGVREGELRIRLRVRLRGQMVMRADERGLRRVWATAPRPGDRPLEPNEERVFQWWRDEYFDGTWVY